MTPRPVPKMDMGDEFLTTEQLAAYLHVSPQTVRQWRWQRQGPPGFRVGRRVLFPRSGVEAWLAEQATGQAV